MGRVIVQYSIDYHRICVSCDRENNYLVISLVAQSYTHHLHSQQVQRAGG